MKRREEGTPGLVVGGIPRIDLLPPEVHQRIRARKVRRGLGMLVVAVVVAVGGGTAAAMLNAAASEAALDEAQARTQELLAQQVEFMEVTQLANTKAAIEQALLVGSSTEILWPEYLAAVNATLPPGTAISSLTVTGSSPIALVPQPSLPLQVPRVATVQLSVAAPDLATVSAWISRLPELPGFADATLASIEPAEAGVRANVTLNITHEAFANRYAPVDAASDDEGES